MYLCNPKRNLEAWNLVPWTTNVTSHNLLWFCWEAAVNWAIHACRATSLSWRVLLAMVQLQVTTKVDWKKLWKGNWASKMLGSKREGEDLEKTPFFSSPHLDCSTKLRNYPFFVNVCPTDHSPVSNSSCFHNVGESRTNRGLLRYGDRRRKSGANYLRIIRQNMPQNLRKLSCPMHRRKGSHHISRSRPSQAIMLQRIQVP